jgi:hypothetical protein
MSTRSKFLGVLVAAVGFFLGLALREEFRVSAQAPAAAPVQAGRYQYLQIKSGGGQNYEGILDTGTGKFWGLLERDNRKRDEPWAEWVLLADEPKPKK